MSSAFPLFISPGASKVSQQKPQQQYPQLSSVRRQSPGTISAATADRMKAIRSRYGSTSTGSAFNNGGSSRFTYIKSTRPGGIGITTTTTTNNTNRGTPPPPPTTTITSSTAADPTRPSAFRAYGRFPSSYSSSVATPRKTTFGGVPSLNIKPHRRPICVPSHTPSTTTTNSSSSSSNSGTGINGGGRRIMSLGVRSPRSKAAAAAAAAASRRGGDLAGDKRKAPHIKVCVRIRPLNSSEPRGETVVEVVDGNTLIFDPEYRGNGNKYGSTLTGSMLRGANGGIGSGGGVGGGSVRRGKNSPFGFDHVYDMRATQEEVYRGATEGLVRSVLEGFNASVFAYGATGSGKTYTMMGNERTPGVMGLAMQELWEAIEETKGEYSYEVKVSCLEVYNEKLYDLFVADSPYLEMREDDAGNVCVPRLSVEHPRTVEEVQSMLALANSRRKQSPTDANAESSRSHAVFQVTVLRTPRTVGLTAPTSIGKLSLIDLAGSERASQSKNRNQQLIEGANINRSLLALNSCINALGRAHRTRGGAGGHIPYRNSNLTRLLKDSLGGTARTTMIANISPAARSYEDTFNTLTYASNAKNIRINARPKTEDARTHIGNYKAIIESLSAQVTDLKARLAALEAERARCSCSAKDAAHNALLDRARTVASERAALLGQLEALSNRLRAFAAIKYADSEEPPLLRESRDARERILRALKANELRALRLSNEINALPKARRTPLLADITGVTGDMMAAHGAFMKAVVREDSSLLRSIFSSGALSASSPLLPKLQTAILIGDSASDMSPLSFVPTPFPSSSTSSSSSSSSSSASFSFSSAIPAAGGGGGTNMSVSGSSNSSNATASGTAASTAAVTGDMDLINVSGTFALGSAPQVGGSAMPTIGSNSGGSSTFNKPHPTIDDLAAPPGEFSFSNNAARTPLKNIYTLAHSSPFKHVKRAFAADDSNGVSSTNNSVNSGLASSPLKKPRMDSNSSTSASGGISITSAATAVAPVQPQALVFPSVPSFSVGSPVKTFTIPESARKDINDAAASLSIPPSATQHQQLPPQPQLPLQSLSSSQIAADLHSSLSSSTLALLQQQDQQSKTSKAADLINKAAAYTTGRPFIPSTASSLTSSSSSTETHDTRRVGAGNGLEAGTDSETRVPSIEQVKQLRGILKTSGRNDMSASIGAGNANGGNSNASSGSERGGTGNGLSKTVTFLEPGRDHSYDRGTANSSDDDRDSSRESMSLQFKRSPHPIFTKKANLSGSNNSNNNVNSGGGGSLFGKPVSSKFMSVGGIGNSSGGGGSTTSAASFFQPKSRWLSNKL